MEDWHTVSGSTLNITNGKFSMPARDVVIIAAVGANTNTKYTINYYVQKLGANGQPVSGQYDTLDSYPRTGTTGETVSAHSKTYEGDSCKTITEANAAGITVSNGGETLSASIAGDGSLTFNFYYTRNQYTVTYAIEGHTPTDVRNMPNPMTVDYYYGAEVSVAGAPTAEGYTFDGWRSISTDITGGKFNMPATNVTIVGSFTPVTDGSPYTVKYYLKNLDGTYAPPRTQEYVGTAMDPETVSPAGFTGFALNWDDTKASVENKNSTGPNTFNDADHTITGTILGDHSLVFAFYYDRNTYTVTYEYDGTVPAGANPSAANVGNFDTNAYKYGQEVTVKEIVKVPDGYTFSGFAPLSGSTITVEGGKFTMPARNVELIGHFTPNSGTTYTVRHYLKDLEGDGYTEITNYPKTGTTDTIGSANERASDFDGAVYDKDKTAAEANAAGLTVSADGETLSGNIAGDGSLELKFYYNREEYTVSYVYDGYEPTDADPKSANLPAPTTYKFGQTVTRIKDATAEGYDFSGWDLLTHDFTVAADGTFTMPARNVRFHGSFTPKIGGSTFKVQHYLQQLNGEYELKNETTYNGTARDTGIGNARDYEGFAVNKDKTVAENDGHTVSADGKVVSGTILGDHSLVLAFYYDRNTYTITYEYEGAAPAGAKPVDDFNNPQVTVVYGEEVTVKTMPENGVPKGYTFSGFAPLSGSTITVEGGKFTMPARNVELIGHFTPNSDTKYTITHYVQKIDADGNVIDGYDILDTYERTATTDTSVNASARVFDGVTFDPTTTAAEANKTANVTVSADGKTLTGNVAGDGSLKLDFFYTRNTYKVSYIYDGHRPTNASALPAPNQNVKFGQVVVLAPDATAAGYRFNGWTIADTSDVSLVGTQFTMPARDVVIHGTFTPIPNGATYTVRHWVQSVDDPLVYELPTDHDHQHVYTRTGTAMSIVSAVPQAYTGFEVNWDKMRDEASTKDASFELNVNEAEGKVSGKVFGDGTLVLDFYYDRNSYEVEYEYEGTVPEGANPSAANVGSFDTAAYMYGKEVTVKEIVKVPDGYAFAGWKKTDGVDGILYVFTAQWKTCTPISSKDAVDVDGTPAKHDPPVKKVVKGDKPLKDDKFVFEFKAIGNTAGLAQNPMPSGSDGQVKRVTLKAGEEYEFGEMIFTVPGTYNYVITEVNDHLAGYTYDTTAYTVTYIVEQDGDSLKATRLFRKDGKDVSIATFEFNNTYKTSIPETSPRTGDDGNLVLWLCILISSLLALIAMLWFGKRRCAE